MKLTARQVVCMMVVFICFLASAARSLGQTIGTCAEQISPFTGSTPNNLETPAINDLGEIVWTQFDNDAGKILLNSSIRGQIPIDTSMPARPSINNRGDLVWSEGGNVYGIVSGKRIMVSVQAGFWLPWINDHQEIVAVRSWPNGIYSTFRGQLANDDSSGSPSINNKGDVVWTQYDPATGTYQIYGIIAGVPTQVTTNVVWNSSPSINDSGEIVWSQPDDTGLGAIYSSVRGRISTDCLPNMSFSNTAVNNCGDVVATGFDPALGSAVFRIGNASPCGSAPEPNNDQQSAVLLASGRTITGVLDPMSNTTDWYRFTARAGDPISLSVNWGASNTPGQLDITLLDADGMSIGTAGGSTNPSNLDTIAPYSGTYYIRMQTLSGRYGYGLYLKTGIGSGGCPDQAITADSLALFGSPDNTMYSMNALGEIIWSKYDAATGGFQIFSSTRGQLTFDMVSHDQASGNNRGDLVWIQNGQIYGILSGTQVQLTNGQETYVQPAINDLQEVVAVQLGSSGMSIYSTRRGVLAATTSDTPLSLNNKGDVVWAQFGETGAMQVYGIISGVVAQLTTDIQWHSHPSINDTGEAIWSQQQSTTPGLRIFSNVRRQLTFDCPYGPYGSGEHSAPVLNSCGDIAFMDNQENGLWAVYHLGSASPCVPDALTFNAQVDVPRNTAIVSNSVLVTGLTTTTSIVIAGGEYEINNSGVWTSANGKIANGDSVHVSLMSSDKGSTTTEANLFIGGGIGTFKVTTLADTPPPTVVIYSPASAPTNNNKPLLTYTASTGTVVVAVDGAVVPKVSGETLDALVDGMHTVSVQVTDALGRTASASATFTVDTQAPIVSISNPVPSSTNVNTPQLIYSVSDGTVVVKVDGIVVNKTSGSTLDPLADGVHVVRVEATDIARNTGFAEVSFTIDTVPPTISIDPVESPTNDKDVFISGTRENGASVSVSIDTSAVVGPISHTTATTWSCMIDGMIKGTNTITATATDAAGNKASVSKSISVK